MMRKMWFGTRGFETWVPAPAINADFSKKGWKSRTDLQNGGVRIRRGPASHAEYNMAWNLGTQADLRPIGDFFDGLYGSGLIYFIDPMASAVNVLPQHWAFPAQAAAGAPSLFPGQKPTLSTTPANTLRYPAQSAKYTGGVPSASLYIPIPPGHALWVGAHGTGTGGLRVAPVGGSAAATPALLPVTSTTRMNASFTGTGADLTITGTPTLSGLMAQILPLGQTPATGQFLSGQGHSGCDFEDSPAVTAYSAVLKTAQIGMTAKLVEVGAWLPQK